MSEYNFHQLSEFFSTSYKQVSKNKALIFQEVHKMNKLLAVPGKLNTVE